MKSKNIRSLFFLLAIILACGLVLWPLLKPGFYISDDGEWMIIRLTAFFQSLKEGQFPTRFLGRLNYGYGYPVANFLYPGFLYIGSFIHILGFSFVDSIKILLGLSVTGAAIFLFLGLRKVFSQTSSFFGTLSFILSPYVSFDLYHRGSVGEVLAFFPASVSFYAIMAAKNWLLPLSIAFLVVSHNSVALLVLFFLLPFIIIKKAWSLFLPVGIGMGLSTFFWFPALYERKYVVFDMVNVANWSQYFLGGEQILLVGFVSVVAFFILILAKNKTKLKISPYFFLAIFALGTFMATSLSTPLWNVTLLSRVIQFPYRFLAITTLAGSWLVASAMGILKKEARIPFVIFCVFVWFVSLLPIFKAVVYVVRPTSFYTTNEATTTVADEYMPRWLQIKPTTHPDRRIDFYKGSGTLLPKFLTTQRMNIDVTARTNSILQINTMYYPGWGVTIDDQPVTIDYHNPEGVMRVSVPQGQHRMLVEFRETISRFLADSISVASIIGYFFYIIFQNRNKAGNYYKKVDV